MHESVFVRVHLPPVAFALHGEGAGVVSPGIPDDANLSHISFDSDVVITHDAIERGMRQKVAICCAYLQQPQVIMFDEPHTGLDPLAIRSMKSTIQQRADAGAAVIVSSHLLGLIEDLCTHLLILSKGNSLFCGTLDELRSQHPELETGTSLEEIFFKATIGVGGGSREATPTNQSQEK